MRLIDADAVVKKFGEQVFVLERSGLSDATIERVKQIVYLFSNEKVFPTICKGELCGKICSNLKDNGGK